MKHIESAHQAQVVEWSKWAYKTVVCYGSKEAIAAIQAYYEQQKV